MSRTLIGRTVRRLRTERGLSQQALATRLGISASYLNLIEHDQRAVTASLLIKLGETLRVDLGELSGTQERQLEVGLREAFADPLLGADDVAEAEVEALAAGSPNAARAVLALYRAWRVAREDANGIALPSGRRILLPNEEVRDFFDDHANHFPVLEEAAESLANELAPGAPGRDEPRASPNGCARFMACGSRSSRWSMALRRYDPATRSLALSESLPRESRGFHMAFQLALLEAREAVEAVLKEASPSTAEAAMLMRIGLLNYVAGALVMPYAAFHAAASGLRHDMEAIAARFGVSFEQACHRLSTLQRVGARGVPFFFLRVDPAGNVSKRFSAAGFPFARFGGSCPRWVVHTAFAQPNTVQVQIAELPDGAAYLCFASRGGAAGGAVGRAAPDPCGGDGLRPGQCRRGRLRRRSRPGPRARRHRPVLPAVRPPGLRQPSVSAAGAPAVAGSADRGHHALSVRGEAALTSRACFRRYGVR